MTNFKKIALMLMFAGPYNVTFLQGAEVKQIQSLAQISGTTCGYYTLANAHAVQKLFNEGVQLSEDNIKLETNTFLANHFNQFFGSNRTFAEESTPLLDLRDTVDKDTLETSIFNLFGLNNNLFQHAYVIQYMPDSLSCPLYIAASLYPDEDGRALINIKNTNRKLVHFIYHIGNYNSGHWVYVGVIKEAGKDPYIIHLNSTNAPIAYSHDVQVAIAHIQKCIESNTPLIVHETDEQIAQRLGKEGITYTKETKTIVDKKGKVKDDLSQIANDALLAQKLHTEEETRYAELLAHTLSISMDNMEPVLTNFEKSLQLLNDEILAQRLQQEEQDAVYAQQLQNNEEEQINISFLDRIKRFFR